MMHKFNQQLWAYRNPSLEPKKRTHALPTRDNRVDDLDKDHSTLQLTELDF